MQGGWRAEAQTRFRLEAEEPHRAQVRADQGSSKPDQGSEQWAEVFPRGRALRELGCEGSLGAPLWSCGNPGRQRCSISEGDGRHTWGLEGQRCGAKVGPRKQEMWVGLCLTV